MNSFFPIFFSSSLSHWKYFGCLIANMILHNLNKEKKYNLSHILRLQYEFFLSPLNMIFLAGNIARWHITMYYCFLHIYFPYFFRLNPSFTLIVPFIFHHMQNQNLFEYTLHTSHNQYSSNKHIVSQNYISTRVECRL